MSRRNAVSSLKAISRRRFHPSRVRHNASAADFIQPASTDDKILVSLFDRPSSKGCSSPFSSTGLFGHPSLTRPAALVSLAESTLVRAQWLTARISAAAQSRDELFKVVKNLDRLSDLLCGVIDLTELVRNAHPDRKWVEAANTAYESMCEFMNVLNTHQGLYEVLKTVLADKDIVSSLSPEAYQTALIFWHDFERSIVPASQRDNFVSLTSQIIVLGRQFQKSTEATRPPASIPAAELAGLTDPGLGVRLKLQAKWTQKDLLVYPGSVQAHMIMRSAPSEEARRRVYVAANSSTDEQVHVLEEMLAKRAELARLVGKESFAHMTLGDKMAKSPENVHSFLDALLDHTRPYARSALLALAKRKQAQQNLSSSFPIVQAWDRDFYCPPEPPTPPISLPPITVGTAFMALSRLFKHLYGVSFRHATAQPGELWHADVQKMEVVDETHGVIGCVYADLFARRGKASGAAHYTVRCSRRLDLDDVQGDNIPSDYEPIIRPSLEFESDKAVANHRTGGIFQLPLVVLLCGFSKISSSSAAELQWHEVITLFHEMGHAMHSMLGRTEYQNVSGTRCPTDFVELPSILMEHFLDSPKVLSLFDVESTRTIQQEGNHHSDPCHSIDTYSQILLAAIDQVYHSPTVFDPSFSSTKEWEKLHNVKGIIPYVTGTSFQTQFGHLYGYGATYYSYLLDRAIAAKVWKDVFSSDPLERERGERYKNEVLAYGGGKDPWKMVSSLLKEPVLEGGDAEAMREVGRWRINDEVGTSDARH